jgi:hypothetical protein
MLRANTQDHTCSCLFHFIALRFHESSSVVSSHCFSWQWFIFSEHMRNCYRYKRIRRPRGHDRCPNVGTGVHGQAHRHHHLHLPESPTTLEQAEASHFSANGVQAAKATDVKAEGIEELDIHGQPNLGMEEFMDAYLLAHGTDSLTLSIPVFGQFTVLHRKCSGHVSNRNIVHALQAQLMKDASQSRLKTASFSSTVATARWPSIVRCGQIKTKAAMTGLQRVRI